MYCVVREVVYDGLERCPNKSAVCFQPFIPQVFFLDTLKFFLSLYGHNDQIYRKVGETVAAGDPIGAVGDTGGRTTPALYFEIRRGGRPVDPQPWFRTRSP